ncbi:hypothetical protein [Klebsiella pasteurii]|uniref:hypothetical protein n=1 Tax=Klebsiella pasteurii TaxID=2587529 RepID=UPI0035CEBD2A
MSDKKKPEESPGFWTREGSEYWAKNISYVIQYCIFITLTLLLSVKGAFELLQTISPEIGALRWSVAVQLLNINTLLYVSGALAISSGLQLAYMLVTHGPDEAIEPVMLGIASAVLLLLAKTEPQDWNTKYATVLLIMIVCIAILFALSKWMSHGKSKKEANSKDTQ